MPSNSKIFFYTLIFFILGVALATLFMIPRWITYLLYLFSLLIFSLEPKNRKNVLVALGVLGLAIGFVKTSKELDKIYFRVEGPFEKVVMVSAVQEKDDYQQIVIKDVSKPDEKEYILANAEFYPKYQIGDILKISCTLQNPKNKYEKFDYVRYLAKDNIYQICQKAKIEKIDKNFQNQTNWSVFTLRKIFQLNEALVGRISKLYPEPEGAYLAGLLLGGSNRLPVYVQEYFKRTGTTHTVAVSGYNITLIAECLLSIGIALGLWRKQAFYAAVAGIIVFVILVGYPSSAVRAALMGGLLLWAMKNGRLAQSLRAIVFAGALMIWCSPLILFYDVGFQLSFLACLGIVLLYAPLAEKVGIKNDFFELKSTLMVTLAAQLGVLGIMLYTFETISPVSLLVNMLILPAIPLIMLGGVISLAISFFSLGLAKIVAMPVWAMLYLEIQIVKYFSQTKFSMIEIKGLGKLWLLLYYIFFICLVVKLKRAKNIERK